MNNAIVLEISGSAKEQYLESRKTHSAAASSFMFVNESSHGPTYKSGNRRDVRAHVRKVVSKQFGLIHKTSKQRAESLPKYAPLTVKAADPGITPDADCHRECTKCSSRRDGTSSSSSTTLIEITESRSKTISRTIVTRISDSDNSQHHSASHCHACGHPLVREKYSKLRSQQVSNLASLSMHRRKTNLVDLLGAGRVDPFATLPMDETNRYSQELLDHGKKNPKLS